ncbi:hypothetical protein FBR04_15635 [Betaproteobacteria bacterium PRO7]|nr:hypothetical protein [Betaproteobacteria bacterium PRO7]
MRASQPLGEIADVVRGISFPKHAKSLEPRSGDVACLRTTNVQREVEWDDLWYVPSEHVKRAEQFVQAGDILISTANSYELVGKVALVSAVQRQATLGAFISLIRARPGVDPRFLYHQLAWGRTQSRIRETASTTTNISNVSTKQLAALELDVPSLDDQRRIVAELEKQFSRLDGAVANLQRSAANLLAYKQAAVREAIWGDRSAAPATEDLPRGWSLAALSELGELGRGKSKHRPRNDPKLYGGQYPFIQTGDVRRSAGEIREFTQTYSEFGLQQSRLWPAGTLCITIAANIAETGILAAPACFPDSVVGFVSADETLVRYVELFFRTIRAHLERFAHATAQKNINLSILERIQVPLPPASERERIVAEVDRRLSIAKEVEAEVRRSMQRASNLRQAALQDAFN